MKKTLVCPKVRFGNLTVESFSRTVITKSGGKLNYWNCKCDCGNTTEVINRNLTGRHTLSCGCYKRQRIIETSTIHGFARPGKVHRIHMVWRGILARCNNKNNPSFKRYGARGIQVCERWLTFKNFADDMFKGWRPGLEIDRKDNDGHYSPENCRWATRSEQSNNRRSNIFIEFRGERKTAQQWAKKFGIPGATIRYRIKNNWGVVRSLTTPVKNVQMGAR